MINLQVTRAAAPYGYYYAPDPSSQQICSIGGNVAENSGGAHCLKYGFTTNHVLGIELVTPDGDVVRLGGKAPDPPGYDLLGAFVGSEGTLGIATEVTLRLTRKPEAVRTLLAAFHSTDEAGGAVSDIIGAGVIPAAIEMMDALAIEAAEEAVHCDYPEGCGRGAHRRARRAGGRGRGPVRRRSSGHCRRQRCLRDPDRRDDAERALFWKGRKSAFAAVGRISPDYIVQDGVIPRTALPDVLRRIAELSGSSGVRVANVFHAGDGNLHPLGALRRVGARGGGATPRRSPARSSTSASSTAAPITGEHGVGMDKAKYMSAHVHRRRPRHHAAAALRLRPGPPLQPREDLPDASALR